MTMKFVLLIRTFVLAVVVHFVTASPAFTSTPSDLVKKYSGLTSTLSFTPSENIPWSMTWALDTNDIYIAIEAKTTGWVGLGIAEAAGMLGSDILMGHVANGKAHIGDYHAIGNTTPLKDGCQDWTLHFGQEVDGYTLLVVSRKLKTNDSNDRPLLIDSLKRMNLLAAYGGNDNADAYDQHASSARIKFTLNLKTGKANGKEACTKENADNKDLTYIDLYANESDDVAGIGGVKHTYQTPQTGGQPIPTTRTTYWEYCYKTKTAWTTMKSNGYNNIVAFEGKKKTPNTAANVHHFVLYGFENDNCDENKHTTVIWVGGMTFFDELPKGVGIPFKDYKSFRLQVHYDNITGASGLKDNNGLRMWLSKATMQHEAGVLQLGDGILAKSGTAIKPGRSSFEWTCAANTTNNWPHKITVFGSILHMHGTGDQMYTEITKSDGTTKTRPNAVEYFSFAHQDPTLVQTYDIEKGDKLTTKCWFNNKTDKDLKFGLGSEDEMCIDFLFYYPYNKNIGGHCTQGMGGTYEGTVVLSKTSNGMRNFGTKVGVASDPVCPKTPHVVSLDATLRSGVDMSQKLSILSAIFALVSFIFSQ